MFVIFGEYLKPLEEVERCLEAHRAFLRTQFEQGRFLVAGPQQPRTGGVIIANDGDRQELEAFLANDPFVREGVAAFRIIEFKPTGHAPGFEAFLQDVKGA